MESRRLLTRKSALRIIALTGVALLMGGCEGFIREAENVSREERWELEKEKETRRTRGEGNSSEGGKSEGK